MNTGLPDIKQDIVGKKSIGKRNIKKFIIVGAAVLLIAVAVLAFFYLKNLKSNKSAEQRMAPVTKGNISVSITGSAPIESANRRDLSPKVTSTVKKMYFKAGDQVKEGDVMFELDDTDAQLAIEDTQNQIDQTLLSQSSDSESISGLTVRAPFSGIVSNINARVGDNIGKGSPIATLTDTSKLKVTLPFNSTGIKDIKAGKKAVVYLQDLMQSVDGTVSSVSSKPYSSTSGAQLYNVEITITNPGSLKDGMSASAEISTSQGTASSVESGTLSYVNTTLLRSDAGGILKSLDIDENQYVNSGDVLAVLQNDDLKLSAETTDLKLEGLQRQLQIKQEQLSYYKIVAPCDGTIISEDVKEGDTVKPGDSLAVVSDMNHLQFEVNIDELDIAKLQVGQKVNITADALPDTANNPLAGQVSQIAMEGTSSNGVTTYPVTVTVTDIGKLKIGMNVNAEIMVSEKNDVLMVPLEAIHSFGGRSFVYVQGAGANGALGAFGGQGTRRRNNGQSGTGSTNGTTGANSSNTQSGQQQGNAGQGNTGSARQGYGNFQRAGNQANSYYKNAHMVMVETGINNDSYIEITSGLTEGEQVILPQLTTSNGTSSNSSNSRQGFGGMLGGMGGGGGTRTYIGGENGGNYAGGGNAGGGATKGGG